MWHGECEEDVTAKNSILKKKQGLSEFLPN
jgi:hypothetical protein